MKAVQHIHHITAIGGHPQENLHFYRDILGFKLVKQTVNFDDTKNYHFYFANKNMDNGTILTFFPWATTNRGIKGSGQVGRILLAIPKGSIDYWHDRLVSFGIAVQASDLFHTPAIFFDDIHSIRLAMIETQETSSDNEVIGFYGSEILSSDPEASRLALISDFGLIEREASEQYYHFETVGEAHQHIIMPKRTLRRGRDGVGTVHHIAWSVVDDVDQQQWQSYLTEKGYKVTDVKDRNYFKSIYMRERGHVIFEYATDGPGFLVDEPLETVGTHLMLPEKYEDQREAIINKLPTFNL